MVGRSHCSLLSTTGEGGTDNACTGLINQHARHALSPGDPCSEFWEEAKVSGCLSQWELGGGIWELPGYRSPKDHRQKELSRAWVLPHPFSGCFHCPGTQSKLVSELESEQKKKESPHRTPSPSSFFAYCCSWGGARRSSHPETLPLTLLLLFSGPQSLHLQKLRGQDG